ncbi:hypothetical protein ACFLVU_02410 [Chloroflexota bacterium]
MRKFIPKRGGKERSADTTIRLTMLWPCKDGYISWFFWGGVMSLPTNVPLIKWMDAEGMADDFVKEFDWSTFGAGTSQETVDRIEEVTGRFFMSYTKTELFEGALKHRVMVLSRIHHR